LSKARSRISLKNDQARKAASETPPRTQPKASTDHYNDQRAMRAAALRVVDIVNNVAYAQVIEYANARSPLEGQLVAVGDWERVYPHEGDFYMAMVPYLSPLMSAVDGQMITDPDVYKTLRDNDQVVPEALGLEIATVELIRHGRYSVVMMVDKLPGDVAPLDPTKIKVGSYGS